MKILVVDDEKLLVKGIRFNLENEGYEVITGCDGMEAVELAGSENPDLIVLDLMMPRLDGLEACGKIREFSDVPIIMLTAKADDMDKLLGFEHGADDYLTKPFNILELKARIKALLRRSRAGQKQQAQPDSKLVCGHITLDRDARDAYNDGQLVDLTAKEFDLMELLMQTRTGSTRASRCSTPSGATTPAAISAPWTCISGGFVKSSSAALLRRSIL